ncbi:MAG: hypothetical protein IJY01_03725 [Clostridia bacterium]|nr:hypothetical protein [Clostridia bacterium]
MAKCEICGNDSQEYIYCTECFKKIEEGESYKCKLCGKQYLKGTRCKCIIKPLPEEKNSEEYITCNLCGTKHKKNERCKCTLREKPEEEYTICKTCGEKYKKNESCKCTLRLSETHVVRNYNNTTPNTTNIRYTTGKEKPLSNNGCAKGCLITLLIILGIIIIGACVIGYQINRIAIAPSIELTHGQTITDFTELQVEVTCKDDYDYVIIELEIYDKNGNVIKQTTLKGVNYKKGRTYILSYQLTPNEILNAKKYKVIDIDYK